MRTLEQIQFEISRYQEGNNRAYEQASIEYNSVNQAIFMLFTKRYFLRFWKNRERDEQIVQFQKQQLLIRDNLNIIRQMNDKKISDLVEEWESIAYNTSENFRKKHYGTDKEPGLNVLYENYLKEKSKWAAEEAVKEVDEEEKGQMIPVDYPKVIVIDESKTPDNDPYLKELRKNLYRPQEPEMPIKLIEVDEDYKMLESLVNSIKGKPEMLNYLEGLIKAAEDDKLDKELKKESQNEKFYYDFSSLGKRDTGIENCTG